MADTYTFHGHGTHALSVAGHKVIIDPYFDENPSAVVKAADIEADYILVSHGHGDHIADAVPIAKRTGAQCIANAEVCGWLRKQGVEAHAQHIGGGYQHPFGYLKFTLAVHGSGLPDGSDGGMPAGFLLTTPAGKKVYLACDTGLFGDMRLIGEAGLDLAILPIGDNFTMGPDDALKAVQMLEPKVVVPTHYNTWPPIEQDAQAWADRVRKETRAKVEVLQPGESLDL